MDNIKYLDFFTIKFYFYTNNQPKYRNIFGGIMNIIYILFCIGIFIGFSYNDLKRLNPISSKSEIPDSKPKIINVDKEKIWIPFRIIKNEEKFFDHRGLLYILPYYVKGKYNDSVGMQIEYHLLDYKLCNETSMANKPYNFKMDIPLNELFCININKEDVLLGGSWHVNYINYIEINLHLCKDGINFNSSDPRCTKIEDLLKNEENSWAFEFFFPLVQFQPTNLETPMVVIYRNYYYKISANANKIEKLFLEELIISDDRDLIFTNFKNTSYWGMSSLYGDDYYIENYDIDPISKIVPSRIYSLNIIMENRLIYYTRTYKKIFIILSDVFPLFKFILYFIKKLTQHVKMSLTKRKLTGLLFENKIKTTNSSIKIEGFKENLIKNENKNNSDKILNNNYINNKKIQQNNHINPINKKNKDEDNNLIKSSKYFSINNSNMCLNNNNIKILDKKPVSSINLKNINIEPTSIIDKQKIENMPSSKNKIQRKKSLRKKYIFPFYYFFFDFYFYKIINPQKFFLYLIHILLYIILCHKYMIYIFI